MKKLFLLLGLITIITSCTENQRSRSFGGEETILLKPNHDLITATWKQNDLWILTKDTLTNICYFKEKSSWGILEGTITIK